MQSTIADLFVNVPVSRVQARISSAKAEIARVVPLELARLHGQQFVIDSAIMRVGLTCSISEFNAKATVLCEITPNKPFKVTQGHRLW